MPKIFHQTYSLDQRDEAVYSVDVLAHAPELPHTVVTTVAESLEKEVQEHCLTLEKQGARQVRILTTTIVSVIVLD